MGSVFTKEDLIMFRFRVGLRSLYQDIRCEQRGNLLCFWCQDLLCFFILTCSLILIMNLWESPSPRLPVHIIMDSIDRRSLITLEFDAIHRRSLITLEFDAINNVPSCSLMLK